MTKRSKRYFSRDRSYAWQLGFAKKAYAGNEGLIAEIGKNHREYKPPTLEQIAEYKSSLGKGLDQPLLNQLPEGKYKHVFSFDKYSETRKKLEGNL